MAFTSVITLGLTLVALRGAIAQSVENQVNISMCNWRQLRGEPSRRDPAAVTVDMIPTLDAPASLVVQGHVLIFMQQTSYVTRSISTEDTSGGNGMFLRSILSIRC